MMWPPISREAIEENLLCSEVCDGSQASARKSMEAVNFLSGWMDTVPLHEMNNGTVLLKVKVTRSQTVNEQHSS